MKKTTLLLSTLLAISKIYASNLQPSLTSDAFMASSVPCSANQERSAISEEQIQQTPSEIDSLKITDLTLDELKKIADDQNNPHAFDAMQLIINAKRTYICDTSDPYVKILLKQSVQNYSDPLSLKATFALIDLGNESLFKYGIKNLVNFLEKDNPNAIEAANKIWKETMPKGEYDPHMDSKRDYTYINLCRPPVRRFYLELLESDDREKSSTAAYKLLEEVIFVDEVFISNPSISDTTLKLIKSKL